MSGDHPRNQLVPAFGNPVRFSLVAALSATENTDFKLLRDQLQVTDSALSKQASYLADLGFVRIKKGYVGKWPRTWLRLTDEGRRAWEDHLAALRAIVAADPLPPAKASTEAES